MADWKQGGRRIHEHMRELHNLQSRGCERMPSKREPAGNQEDARNEDRAVILQGDRTEDAKAVAHSQDCPACKMPGLRVGLRVPADGAVEAQARAQAWARARAVAAQRHHPLAGGS